MSGVAAVAHYSIETDLERKLSRWLPPPTLDGPHFRVETHGFRFLKVLIEGFRVRESYLCGNHSLSSQKFDFIQFLYVFILDRENAVRTFCI